MKTDKPVTIMQDIRDTANNIDMKNMNSSIVKQLMVAAVMDLITFSPEIINKTIGLDKNSQTILNDTKLTMKISDTLYNTNSRQSCVLNLVKNNPEIVKYIIEPITEKVKAYSTAKLGQAGYNLIKGKLFHSSDKDNNIKANVINKVNTKHKVNKNSSKNI